MKINGKTVIGDKFAFDGCHKIYICKTIVEENRMADLGYKLYPLEQIEECYNNSCELRFIEDSNFEENYVGQFKTALFS